MAGEPLQQLEPLVSTEATGAVGYRSKLLSGLALFASAGVVTVAAFSLVTKVKSEVEKSAHGSDDDDARSRVGIEDSLIRVSTGGNIGPAGTVTNSSVAYVGCGCFWHVQHVMVHFEEKSFGRYDSELTSFTGYAGGTSTGSGGRVCYHNFDDVADYGQLGHAEVVSVALPDVSAAAKLGKVFFGQICPGGNRDDPQDVGAEYRALAGFPGGLDSSEGKAFADEGKQLGVKVVAGKGNDPDTPGTVYVMDTDKFPFHQAELYHQFHDDMIDAYSSKYHALSGKLSSSDVIRATGCPNDGVPTA